MDSSRKILGFQPTRTAHLEVITFEDGEASMAFYAEDAEYFTTHTVPNTKSFFNPPLHLHLYQSEEFRVVSGVGRWHIPSRGEIHTKSAGGVVQLPAGVPHRFENTSDTVPLVVEFRIDPNNAKVNRRTEERFFRNFFGYLDDCRKNKIAPSIFQLQLFLWTVDGPLAIPVPGPEFVKWHVSRLFAFVLGVWIGKFILGYKESYQEYYVEKATE